MTAISYLAATPFLWALLFWSFVLRARFRLGHWPAPYQPDPKDLGFVVHYYLLLAGMPLALAAAVVVPAVVLFSSRTLSRSPPAAPRSCCGDGSTPISSGVLIV